MEVNKKELQCSLYSLLVVCCELCGIQSNKGEGICCDCEADLPFIINGCVRCGSPSPGFMVCGKCIVSSSHIDNIIAPFLYLYPVDTLIKNIKYKQRLSIIPSLAEHLINQLIVRPDKWPDFLVPVPLHTTRSFFRGFNQSVEICKILGRELKIPCDYSLIKRIRNTSPMFNLGTKDREKNISNAFRVTRRTEGLSIAIIDDVVTSGATGNELARLLKLRGAKRVQVWALARA